MFFTSSHQCGEHNLPLSHLNEELQSLGLEKHLTPKTEMKLVEGKVSDQSTKQAFMDSDFA